MNSNFVDIAVTVLVAVLSSTGLWKYLETRKSKLVQAIEEEQRSDCNMKELMLYLAKAQICNMAVIFMERGYITNSQAEMLEHLFEPYHELGGNGAGEELYKQAMRLPRRSENPKKGE